MGITLARGRTCSARALSPSATYLRSCIIRAKLGLPGHDVGQRGLIFDAPEADLGVHPTQSGDPPSGTTDISFYCDDIETTVATLKQRGVEFMRGVEDRGYGWVTYFKAPGVSKIQLDQPRHRK